VDLKLFVAADLFHYTQNRCGALRFVKVLSIVGKLDLAVSYHGHLNRKKQISGFGVRPLPSQIK